MLNFKNYSGFCPGYLLEVRKLECLLMLVFYPTSQGSSELCVSSPLGSPHLRYGGV